MNNIIDFIVDGVHFASRTWCSVPNVGDTVIFQDGKTWLQVEKVIWSDDATAPLSIERQWIQLLCKRIEPLTGDKP